MIGQLLLTAPLVAILLYGWLEFERSWVGIGISLITLVAMSLVWFPAGAVVLAEALQLGTREDVLAFAFVCLLLLVALNLHLKNRRQMQVITTLIRRLAIDGRPAISHAQPMTSEPPVGIPVAADHLRGTIAHGSRLSRSSIKATVSTAATRNESPARQGSDV